MRYWRGDEFGYYNDKVDSLMELKQLCIVADRFHDLNNGRAKKHKNSDGQDDSHKLSLNALEHRGVREK